MVLRQLVDLRFWS